VGAPAWSSAGVKTGCPHCGAVFDAFVLTEAAEKWLNEAPVAEIVAAVRAQDASNIGGRLVRVFERGLPAGFGPRSQAIQVAKNIGRESLVLLVAIANIEALRRKATDCPPAASACRTRSRPALTPR
jgi:hypothetical protein